ncbi:MAG: AAA family ATPase [Burkholderiales bacterium]
MDHTNTERSRDELLASLNERFSLDDNGSVEAEAEADNGTFWKERSIVPSLPGRVGGPVDDVAGADDDTPGIDVYSLTAVARYASTANTRHADAESLRRSQALASSLLNRGSRRILFRLPHDWDQRLDELEADYVYADEFFEHIRSACQLAVSDNGVVELDPLLLEGPPGFGKTTLVQATQPVITGEFRQVAMSSIECGSMLSGSQETWSNSQTGMVFRTLTEGRYANPLILLDELDKIPRGIRASPEGPLYQLLEPAVAVRFEDLSIPSVPVNASHVMYWATANDVARIPEPLYQRCVHITIPAPTGEQCAQVVRSVFKRLQSSSPRLTQFTLDDSAVWALVGEAPRDVRKRIRTACGTALRHGRHLVTAADLRCERAQARPMSFMGA